MIVCTIYACVTCLSAHLFIHAILSFFECFRRFHIFVRHIFPPSPSPTASYSLRLTLAFVVFGLICIVRRTKTNVFEVVVLLLLLLLLSLSLLCIQLCFIIPFLLRRYRLCHRSYASGVFLVFCPPLRIRNNRMPNQRWKKCEPFRIEATRRKKDSFKNNFIIIICLTYVVRLFVCLCEWHLENFSRAICSEVGRLFSICRCHLNMANAEKTTTTTKKQKKNYEKKERRYHHNSPSFVMRQRNRMSEENTSTHSIHTSRSHSYGHNGLRKNEDKVVVCSA